MLLSVLDQSPVRSGLTPADAVQETLELAAAADRLGYHRYWLAEHHATSGLAGSAPEILIGHVASRTSRLRVGAGGVMLSHYSPLKVAEQFRMLETLFPGRIDLGLGRAPGSDQLTARALAYGAPRGAELYPRQVTDLIGWLDDALPSEHPFASVKATPRTTTTPEIWMLGSSGESAMLAAHFGVAFAFAHFISADGSVEAMQEYRARFQPSSRLASPRAAAAVFVVCADTEAEAVRLAKSRELFIVRLYTGRGGPYPSVEEAERYPYTPRELAIVEHAQRRRIAGAPEQVREQLTAFAAEHAADELVIVTITHDPKARLRSYELIAEVCGLR
ncbi:MAG: LLM class flavin-dependent oxidoreductase [Candidatus Rokubacteria bacterium]|nr:LLM class flavin-dependent oxidoreductase [Candidatus Rokubacteria bacterium]